MTEPTTEKVSISFYSSESKMDSASVFSLTVEAETVPEASRLFTEKLKEVRYHE